MPEQITTYINNDTLEAMGLDTSKAIMVNQPSADYISHDKQLIRFQRQRLDSIYHDTAAAFKGGLLLVDTPVMGAIVFHINKVIILGDELTLEVSQVHDPATIEEVRAVFKDNAAAEDEELDNIIDALMSLGSLLVKAAERLEKSRDKA